MRIVRKKEPRIPFTPEGHRKLREEKAKLLSQRPEAVDNLRKAREMGDLSENGYYKAARARLSFLDAQLRRVDRLLRAATIVTATGSGRVEIGTTVTISNGAQQHTYSIVGGFESDPARGMISHVSPIGKALMGKTVNDTVTVTIPAGTVRYTILQIS